MKCTIAGCPGDCETRLVTHTVRQNGRVVVIDLVPAEVCAVCGDVLLSPETVRHIEKLLRTAGRPAREVPLYEYA
jgi:YgiT-type zinc finger domain-containing protein